MSPRAKKPIPTMSDDEMAESIALMDAAVEAGDLPADDDILIAARRLFAERQAELRKLTEKAEKESRRIQAELDAKAAEQAERARAAKAVRDAELEIQRLESAQAAAARREALSGWAREAGASIIEQADRHIDALDDSLIVSDLAEWHRRVWETYTGTPAPPPEAWSGAAPDWFLEHAFDGGVTFRITLSTDRPELLVLGPHGAWETVRNAADVLAPYREYAEKLAELRAALAGPDTSNKETK